MSLIKALSAMQDALEDADKYSMRLIRDYGKATDRIKELEQQNAALIDALRGLREEYRDRKCQWGSEYLWAKHEHVPTIEQVDALLEQYRTESAEGEK